MLVSATLIVIQSVAIHAQAAFPPSWRKGKVLLGRVTLFDFSEFEIPIYKSLQGPSPFRHDGEKEACQGWWKNNYTFHRCNKQESRITKHSARNLLKPSQERE
jgi:hypothetical protein